MLPGSSLERPGLEEVERQHGMEVGRTGVAVRHSLRKTKDLGMIFKKEKESERYSVWKSMWENGESHKMENKMMQDESSILRPRDQGCVL